MLGAMKRLHGALLVGLVLGIYGVAASACSTTDSSTSPLPDASHDSRTGSDAPPGGEGVCPAAVVSTLLEWKPPTKTKDNACQQDDLDAMKEFLQKNASSTNEEFEAFVKNRDTVCHDCMFGDSNAATWPAFPVKDNKVLTYNIGACYALVSGKESCGKAIQNEFDCEFVACADCTSQGDLDACRKKARTTVCATTDNATRTECAGIAVKVDDFCGSVFDSVRVQCISLTAEPSDGGVKDAGDGGG